MCGRPVPAVVAQGAAAPAVRASEPRTYNRAMPPPNHESIDLFVSRVLHTLLGRDELEPRVAHLRNGGKRVAAGYGGP